jgi:hypothetical protein
VDRSYIVELPENPPGADGATAQAASTLISTLLAANAAGWVPGETGMRLLFDVLSPETNLGEELERVDLERAVGTVATSPAVSGQPGAPIRFGRPPAISQPQQPSPQGRASDGHPSA